MNFIEFLRPSRQFLVFLVVGGLNSIFGYSLFALFIYMGVHYSMAVLFTTCLGVLFNFKTTGSIVFGNRDKRLLFSFIGVYAFLYVLSVLFIKLIHGVVPNFYVAGAITAAIMAVVGFLCNKRFVFRSV